MLKYFLCICRTDGLQGLYDIEVMNGEDDDVQVLNYLRSLTDSQRKSKARSVSGFFRFTK